MTYITARRPPPPFKALTWRRGAYWQSPFGSFMLVQGLETLSLRGRAHSNNANALALWLKVCLA